MGVLALLLCVGCDDAGAPADGGRTADGGTRADGSAGDDAGATSGGGAIGDACTTDADCTEPPGAECFTTIMNPFDGSIVASFPNGMCSLACDPMGGGDECGEGDVVCASTSMSGGMTSSQLNLCLPACSGPQDCRTDEGYQCRTIFGFGYCSP